MKITELAQDKVSFLLEKSMELLSNPGFRVEDKELRRLASDAGALVDEQTQIIHFPKDLILKLLELTPERYVTRNLFGEDTWIGDGTQHIHAIVTDPWIAQEDGSVLRPSLKDVSRNTRLIASMKEVSQVACMDFPVVEDETPFSPLTALETHLCNHTKHYAVYPTSEERMNLWLELGDILNARKPLKDSALFSVAIPTLSPLALTAPNCQLLKIACKHRFVVQPTVCPMAGSTAPYSQVGVLVQGIAENIAVAILTQLLSPGNPFRMMFGFSVTSLQDGRDIYYVMEKYNWKLATAEMAKYLHVPYGLECGGSMSARFDMQSGAEAMLSMLCAVQGEAPLLCGLGSCYNANGLSTEHILIQYAFLQAAQHLHRGISLEYLDASMESLRTQGCGGHFLMDDLTLELMRSKEFFSHSMFDMAGESRAVPSILDRAKEKAIWADTLPSPVPEAVQQELHRYFESLRLKTR